LYIILCQRKSHKEEIKKQVSLLVRVSLLSTLLLTLKLGRKRMHITPSTMQVLRGKSTGQGLTRLIRTIPMGDKDKSHTKGGKLVNEKRSKNRARNGKGGKASKK